MANHSLGTIRGSIEIDYDGAGIVRAVRDADKAKKSLGSLDGASSKVLGAFGAFASGASKVAAGIGLATNAVGFLSSAVSILAPVLAAGFAVAPALILSYASAMVVAKLATAGVADALKTAGEGGAKFDKALEKLSPEAKKFALAFKDAYPQLKRVQQAMQDAFFKGAPGAVATVVTRIASLQAQAQGVAFALGQIAQNIVKTATSGDNIERLRLILSGVNAFLLRIRNSIGPVVTGFISLAAQASVFGGAVGGKLATALAAFGAWLSKIDLAAVFAKALPILQAVGTLLSNVGSILGSLFGGITSDGAGALGVLSALAAQLAAFLKSAQGQEALAALGTAMQAISGAAGQIFLALLQALAPALVALAPGVTTLATQISSLLVPTINALAPALENVSRFLSDNMSWLGPVAGAVVAVAAAYKVYAAAARAVAAVQAILKSRLVTTVAAWVANTAAIVANRVAQLASAAVTGGAAVAAWVANTAVMVANRVAMLATVVAMNIVKVATAAWEAVQWALNAALIANPIGLVILAIAALVAGIIYAYTHSEKFREIVQRAWEIIKNATVALFKLQAAVWKAIFDTIKSALNGIKNFAVAAWNFIVNSIKAYINLLRTIITTGVNFIRTAWNNFLTGLRVIALAVFRAITSFIQGQINKVKTIIRGVTVVVSIVRNAFNQANAAVKSAIGNIISTVRGIPGRVRSALGGLAGLLYSKGRDLIRGFINGIASMIGAVRAKVSSVVGAVTRFLPGSPAKEGPLSGKGYVLYRARRFMNDFAQGIGEGAQKPAAALVGAVNPLARATVPTGSTTKSGASSAPTTPSAGAGGTREYHLDIDGKTIATIVVDTITGNPKVVSKAADEGNRKRSYAGSGRK